MMVLPTRHSSMMMMEGRAQLSVTIQPTRLMPIKPSSQFKAPNSRWKRKVHKTATATPESTAGR